MLGLVLAAAASPGAVFRGDTGGLHQAAQGLTQQLMGDLGALQGHLPQVGDAGVLWGQQHFHPVSLGVFSGGQA